MRKTIVVAAAAFLAGAGACLAQPAGVTRDMISRALPLEGAPKAEPGPYQVTSEPAFVKTIGVFNSGVQTPPAGQAQGQAGRGGASTQPTADALPNIHGPVLLLNGGDVDFLMGASSATFAAINHVPAFYGSRHNAGHSATYFHPGGGEFANVASNWLLWTLKGDKQAGKMFAGKDCGLCTNSNWDVKSKGIDK